MGWELATSQCYELLKCQEVSVGGSYDEFECGVKIVVDAGAVGKWTCYVKVYRNFRTGREVHADINIKIKQEDNENTSERTSEITSRQTTILNILI